MTGGLVPVSAQWALYGKTRGVYQILACSTGDLSARNFQDAITRFQLGALDNLPQVSVSYLAPAVQSAQSYLALAVHQFAKGQQPALDENGSPITFTSYFCVPYAPLAAHAITYQAMSEALRDILLPMQGGPPLRVAFAAPAPSASAVDPLAMRVAALLLTGAPVCVVGAQAASMGERLRFIDTVMSVLPYGFRARMTAATWTRASAEHRFRLFFSGAGRTGRSGSPPDRVVTWGCPETAVITPADGIAHTYLDWLKSTFTEPLTLLSGLIDMLKFDPDSARKGVSAVVDMARPPSAVASPRGSEAAWPGAMAQSDDPAAAALSECAEHVSTVNLTRLRSCVNWLQQRAMADDITDESRASYRMIIKDEGLLRPHDATGRQAERLYQALLALAFGKPLGYEAYCQVEDCLGMAPGDIPHPALLAAINRVGTADLRTTAIVHARLDAGRKLGTWVSSGTVNPVELIDLLGGEGWHRPQHLRTVCDVTAFYLTNVPVGDSRQGIRRALRRHGFLAPAIMACAPDDEQYQVRALHGLLRAAYPGNLSRGAIAQILTGTSSPPTASLLAAVMLLTARADDMKFAQDAYVRGSLTLMNLAPDTRRRLAPHLPGIANEAGQNTTETGQ